MPYGPKMKESLLYPILVIAYRMLERGQDYQELGGDYFDKRRPDDTVRRLTQRLQQLGYQVTQNPQAAACAA